MCDLVDCLLSFLHIIYQNWNPKLGFLKRNKNINFLSYNFESQSLRKTYFSTFIENWINTPIKSSSSMLIFQRIKIYTNTINDKREIIF